MAKTAPNDQTVTSKAPCRLFDGDFIDLTCDNEPTMCVIDDEAFSDTTSKSQKLELKLNESGLHMLKKVIKNQTVTDLSLVPIVSTGGTAKDNIFIPLSEVGSDKYFLMNQTVSDNNRDTQGIKLLDQVTVTSSSVVTQLKFKNTGGKITVEETPVINNNKSKNVVIQDHIKLLPIRQETVTSTDRNKQILQPTTNFLKGRKEVEKVVSLPQKLKKNLPDNLVPSTSETTASINSTSANKSESDMHDIFLLPSTSESNSKNKVSNVERSVTFKNQKLPNMSEKAVVFKPPSPVKKSLTSKSPNFLINKNSLSNPKKRFINKPSNSVVLPPEKLKILCDGKPIDLTEKRVLYHIDKSGKHGYIIMDRQEQSLEKLSSQVKNPTPAGSTIQAGRKTANPRNRQSVPETETKDYTVIPANPQSLAKSVKISSGTNKLLAKTHDKLVKDFDRFVVPQPVGRKKDNSNVNLPSSSSIETDNNEPVTVLQGFDEDKPVYYVVYPINNNPEPLATPSKAGNLDEEATNEPVEEADSEDEEVQLVEVFESDPLNAPSTPKVTTTVISPSLVTPVDITQILNKAKKPRPEIPDRCDTNTVKRMSLARKGFTRMEMRKPSCLMYLNLTIANEEKDIRRLKKSIASLDTHFVNCHSEPSKFLPETVQCKEDEECYIQHSNIEEQVNSLIFNSPVLPVITRVISKVNDEVYNIKQTQQQARTKRKSNDFQAKMAKPKEALKLIQKGLQLITSWSAENQLDKNKPIKKVRTRKSDSAVDEPKKKKRQAAGNVEISNPPPNRKNCPPTLVKKSSQPTLTESSEAVLKKKSARQSTFKKPRIVKKMGKKEHPVTKEVKKRGPKKRTEQVSTSASKVVSDHNKVKRVRKRKVVSVGDADDNELFIVKKVDILNDNRKIK